VNGCASDRTQICLLSDGVRMRENGTTPGACIDGQYIMLAKATTGYDVRVHDVDYADQGHGHNHDYERKKCVIYIYI